MDLNRADLALLPSLRALLEARGVTAAARRVGISQPAMSAQLARLRDMFGDALLVGNAHGMALTPIAEDILPQLSEGIDMLTQLLRERLPFDPAQSERAFSIASTDYLFSSVLLGQLRQLRKEAPKIRFAMSMLSEGEDWNNKADVCIATPTWSAPDAIRQVLYREHFMLFMRAGHPNASEDITLERYCQLEHMVVSPRAASFSGSVDAALAKQGLSRTVVLSVPSFILALQAVQETDLVVTLPARMARRSISGSVIKPLPFQGPEFDVIATWHPKMRNDPGHQWLRTRLTELSKSETRNGG